MNAYEPTFRPEAIKELIAREKVSQAQFARRMGVSRQLIGAWLSGWVQPRFDTILRMCAEFDVDPSFFAEGLETHRDR